MDKIPLFVKRSGESILYNDDGEFRFYVPEKQFDLKVAKSVYLKTYFIGIGKRTGTYR